LTALNEEQYRQVCEACDSVLLSPDANRVTMAIPWLHVIREHPSFLKEYVELFAPSNALATYLRSVARMVLNVAGWLRQAWRALCSDGKAWKASRPLGGPVDVLFVSHLLNQADAGKAADFYFGELPDLIHAEGRSVVVALIDHVGITHASIVQKWAGNANTRVLLSRSLDFRAELSLFYKLRKESLRLAAMSKLQGSRFLGRVFARASHEAMAGGARTALRMSVQVGQLVATIKPKMMVVTYEGHAWERMVFASARSFNFGVQCAGYQHAALFKMQHSALRQLGASFDPDLIFTAGLVSKTQIENSNKLPDIPVHILGSHRKIVSRSDTKSSAPLSDYDFGADTSESNACLVLPEGIISECLLLFEFSLDCAEIMPEFRFIWRLHPLVTKDQLILSSYRMRNLPINVELSDRSLEEDFKRASHALYRGSTAIVGAVCSGLKPIYLNKGNEMSIDPLYELDAVRVLVSNPLELQNTIYKKKVQTEATTFNHKYAVRYCEDFYSRLDPEIILSKLRQMDAGVEQRNPPMRR